MKYLRYKNPNDKSKYIDLKMLNTYEITKSSQEVSYNDFECDFTGLTADDLPEKYQEVQLIDKITKKREIINTIKEEGTNIEYNSENKSYISDYIIYGDTQQNSYTGKNLLKNTNVNSGDGNYWQTFSTFDEATGTLTRSTTATTESYITHRVNGLKSNTTYTISCLAKSNGNVKDMDIYCFNKNTQGIKSKTHISLTTNFQKYEFTFTTSSDVDYSEASIRFDNNGSNTSGTEAILTIKDVMLAEGTDTDFEPYTGGIPSPNPDYPQAINNVTGLQELNIIGNNLYKPTLKINNTNITYTYCSVSLENDEYSFIASSTNEFYFGEVVGAGSSYSENRGQKIYKNGHEKIAIYLTNTDFDRIYITAYNSSGVSLGYSYILSNSGIYTFPENADFITIRYGKKAPVANTTYKTKVMVVYGDEVPIEYEEYKEQIYEINLGDIELCKIGTYQDYIYKNNETWYKMPNVLKIESYNGETITTDYKSTTGGLDTGATIYYGNDNPVPIEITNTELINQLNQILNKQLYIGYNNIYLTNYITLRINISEHEEYEYETINIHNTGYVDSYDFNNMREIDEFTEINITLLSPMKITTLRTCIAVGTYQLIELLESTVLSPLINDGFEIEEINVTDRILTINYLSETIEYVLNDLSNKYNFWWFIDENKKIYIKDISEMLNNEPDFIYDETHKINGLQYLHPNIISDNYANVINFTNVRVYETSRWEDGTNINGLINEQITPLKKNDQIEFKYPVDIKKENIKKSGENYYGYENTTYYGLYIIGTYSDNSTFELYIRYDVENDDYIISNNIGFDGDENSTKEFLLIKDSFFTNLITGFKYNNENKNLKSIEYIASDSALIWNVFKVYNDKAISEKKGIINDTGIVELTVNMNEQWKTKQELQELATSYMDKNSLKLDGEIELKLDKNLFKVGNTIKIDRMLFNDKYIITQIRETFGKSISEYFVKCKNANITESYINLFRSPQTQENEDKTYHVNISHYSEEGIKETFEVVQ